MTPRITIRVMPASRAGLLRKIDATRIPLHVGTPCSPRGFRAAPGKGRAPPVTVRPLLRVGEPRPQLGGRLEAHGGGRRDLDDLAGAGVPPHPGGVDANGEGAEA